MKKVRLIVDVNVAEGWERTASEGDSVETWLSKAVHVTGSSYIDGATVVAAKTVEES